MTDEKADDFDLADFERDLDAINGGVWVKRIKGAPAAMEFEVLGTTSKKIEALRTQLVESRPDNFEELPWGQQLKRMKAENREVAAAGLLNWKPFRFRGEMTPYSSELAAEFVNSKGIPEFFEWVQSAMRQADETRENVVRETEKNSSDT